MNSNYLVTAGAFTCLLNSKEIAERSIFNFPDIVSRTIVLSASSAIFPWSTFSDYFISTFKLDSNSFSAFALFVAVWSWKIHNHEHSSKQKYISVLFHNNFSVLLQFHQLLVLLQLWLLIIRFLKQYSQWCLQILLFSWLTSWIKRNLHCAWLSWFDCNTFLYSGTVHPQLPFASTIIKSASPVFLKLNTCSTLSPSLIVPKSNSFSSNVITGTFPADSSRVVADWTFDASTLQMHCLCKKW